MNQYNLYIGTSWCSRDGLVRLVSREMQNFTVIEAGGYCNGEALPSFKVEVLNVGEMRVYRLKRLLERELQQREVLVTCHVVNIIN